MGDVALQENCEHVVFVYVSFLANGDDFSVFA